MASATPATSSTKQTTNYSRLCRVLVDVGTCALRDTFNTIYAPSTLHTVLATNQPLLQSLRPRRIINATQWGKLFPAIPTSVSSSNFDITLLIILLRNICGLAPPVTGWDALPAATDMSREADIARVKYFRNTVYAHAEHASVDDATFHKHWKEIRDTLVRLGGVAYKVAIDNLEVVCMDPDVEKHYNDLLMQWKSDEDNIKDVLKDIGKKLDDLVALAVTSVTKERSEEINNGRTTLLLENQRTVRSAASMVNIGRTRPLLENERTVSSAASSMVNIGRNGKWQKFSSMVNIARNGKWQKFSSMVNGRTTRLLDNQSTESSAASMESFDANNKETTGRDNLNLLRIPEALVVSDMEKLHYKNQVMFHSVQKKLDARETLQQKTWRGVGMALGVSSVYLDLIETCYMSQQSPTEALVLRLRNRNCGEPSMREFVRALITCERGDVARIIINWPRWETTGDLVDSG